jgi:hypothetical protein
MRDAVKEQKAAAAKGLTPTLDERPTVAALPNDVGVFMSNEALINHAKELRKFAADAIAIADGLDAMAASALLPASAPVPSEKESKAAAQKAIEAEGDEKAFARDYEAKMKAAQDATFTQPKEEPAKLSDDGWTCDEHGSDYTVKTSRSGTRVYRQCNQCKEFER